jgi:hypothetical protein
LKSKNKWGKKKSGRIESVFKLGNPSLVRRMLDERGETEYNEIER